MPELQTATVAGLVGHELSAFLLDRTRRRVANTLEFVLGNLDLDTRRLTPFTETAVSAVDRELDAHRRLEWQVPRFAPSGLRQGVRR